MTTQEFLNRVLTIIPVRNEEETIASVVTSLRQKGLHHIRVVDNGSTDESAQRAIAAGAEVVVEARLGYGQACWTGLQAIPPAVDWILFCDGDGSDDLSGLSTLFAACEEADFILGNRRATAAGRSALTPAQNFGNWLATTLIHLGWRYHYGDLGPLRLIRRTALEAMLMGDRGFGWTVEMQVKAIELNLRISELPVAYFPRQGGRSKISGTLHGSVQAGVIILSTLGRLSLRRRRLPRYAAQTAAGVSTCLPGADAFVSASEPVADSDSSPCRNLLGS